MKKNFLMVTAFLCGVSVMGVELSANRLLAPYFGSSQIVWTVIIGLIMIFMSLGNYFGGKYADKMENMNQLYRHLWMTAIWILILPLVGKYIILAVTFLLVAMGVHQIILWGSILTCILLFSFPLLVLGTVSPTLVRFGIQDKKRAGEVAGKIYAASNIGSILGSFLPTFFTLPLLGTRKSFWFFAAILVGLCVAYHLNHHNKKKIILTSVMRALILALILVPLKERYAFWDETVIYEGESIYNYLQVKEGKDTRTFSTNVAFGVQSEIQKEGVLTGAYYDYLMFAPFFSSAPAPKDILILGYGTGTMDKLFQHYYPTAQVTGVEIDPKIIWLGQQYFDVNPENTQLHVMDGRTFLNTHNQKYDLIVVDAYQDVNIPFHMATQEFFLLVSKHLKSKGVLSINVNMHDEAETAMKDSLISSLKDGFSHVYTIQVDNSSNLAVIATKEARNLDDVKKDIGKWKGDLKLSSLQDYYIGHIMTASIPEGTLPFRDDRAPVEKYSQKTLQKLIDGEIEWIQKQIDGQGLGAWQDFLK